MKTKKRIEKIFLIMTAVCLAAGFGQNVHAVAKSPYLHFINGLLNEQKGDYGTALDEYRDTMSIDPQADFVHRQAIRLALHIGRLDEALQWGHRLIKIDDKNPENWVMFGMIMWARNNMSAAKEAFEKALALDKDFPDALYQMASILSSSSPENSIKYLQRYLETSPEHAAGAHYQMAAVYNSLGRKNEAILHLKLSIKKEPLFLEPRYSLAQIYEVVGDTVSALSEYLEIFPLAGRNTVLADHIGELYINGGKLKEAEEYFLKTLEIDKSDPSACLWMSVLAEQKKDFKSAVEYVKSSSQYTTEPALRLRLSYYFTQAGSYKEAVSELEEAHKLWPKNAEIAYFLALGLDDLKQTPRALELLGRIVEENPDYTEARFQYGVICERANRIEEAEKQFKILIEKKPKDAIALNYLGYSMADRGMKLSEAEGYIRRALEQEPENGAYLDSLGWVHFKQGKYEQAQAELKKALSIVKEDEIVWDHMGEAYAVAGGTKQAWYCWKMAYMLGPGRKAVADKITRAEKNFPNAVLALMLKEYLGAAQSGFVKFSSFCKISGKIGSSEVSFDGLIYFNAPDEISVEIMGPMFTPLWKMKLAGRQFETDSIQLHGINENDFSSAANLFMENALRYFSGEMFSQKDAVLKKGWSKTRLIGAAGELFLDEKTGLAGSFEPADVKGLSVNFAGYRLYRGRMIPAVIEFKSTGVSVRLFMQKWTGSFHAETVPAPK